ncbi:helix-turn-helix domain-containing protein [Chitinibacter mangrovi]|uniref:helix-turn-helix domain-containing protein n=1 Tax=Chitinibacter mangrovi TaxID=3153927 RepID=UPI003D812804
MVEVAESCGINRMTLSKIAGQKDCSTVTDHIDKLCAYFGCEVGDLPVYVPTDEEHKD